MPTRSHRDIADRRRSRMSQAERAAAAVFDDAATLAADVLALRLAKNYTQTQLAELTGIAQADLSRIEHGHANPTMATYEKLAHALDADLRLIPRQPTPA